MESTPAQQGSTVHSGLPAVARARRVLAEYLSLERELTVLSVELAPYGASGSAAALNAEAALDGVVELFERYIAASGGGSARLGGERLVCWLPRSPGAAERWATRLASEWASGVNLGTARLLVEVTIGACSAPECGADPEILMRRAALALREARRQRECIHSYTPGMEERRAREVELRGELAMAARRGQLSLVYQAQLNLTSGRIGCFEALLRWQHPRLGAIAPDEFIPLAEETGSIGSLTQWVVDEALAQLARWHRQGLALELSINLSPEDVIDRQLPATMLTAMRRHAVAPHSVTLELTEHAAVKDLQRAAETLGELAHHGVKLALDDFGTGHASLQALKALPLSELKVDRAFTGNLQRGSRDELIVRSAVALAHSMKLQVVAEGIESEESLQAASRLGCERAQGYLIGRPMSALRAAELFLHTAGRQRPAARGAAAAH